MRQIIQNLKTGETILEEVPAPQAQNGQVLIQTTRTLVSLGTERMLVDFGKAGYIQKARQQPEKVRQVLDKMRTDGIGPTVEAVRRKLDAPMPLGYCNVGVVRTSEVGSRRSEIGDQRSGVGGRRSEVGSRKSEVGDQSSEVGSRRSEVGDRKSEIGSRTSEVGDRKSGVGSRKSEIGSRRADVRCPMSDVRYRDFKPGDRVASNGPHAEVVCVPENLCTRVPDTVSDDEAAFTVVGAIALQGIRLVGPTFGETVAVIGLGLIGQLTVQLLRANGCQVIGLDIDQDKLELASRFGAKVVNSKKDDSVRTVQSLTQDIGADAVIITASSTSNDIVSQAAGMSRKRGRIVLVGVVGLELNRSEFYEKELSFQVSCSYGPGRYDPDYEEKGHDYPLAYVRWTEKRNFEAFLQALSDGLIDVTPLISAKVPLEDYAQIYSDLGGPKTKDKGESDPSEARTAGIAYLLEYPDTVHETRSVSIAEPSQIQAGRGIAVVGAGNFTQSTVLPALKQAGADLRMIVSSKGLSGTHLAKKYSISKSATDYEQALQDEDVSSVIITTRHHLHADMVIRALEAGKDVFVEKPLCLTANELDEIRGRMSEVGSRISEDGCRKSDVGCRRSDRRPPVLMVGYNRRFSPHARKMKELLGHTPGQMTVTATMNSGYIPAEEWVQDIKTGGGRIIGEACHMVDLITYLTGSLVEEACMQAMGQNPKENTDVATLLLKYANGSLGVINYFANGSKSYDKERVEVYSQGRTLVLENFRRLTGYGFKGFKKLKTRQDKGHTEQFRLLAERIRNGGAPLIPFQEIVNTSRATLGAVQSLREGRWVDVGCR